MRRGFTTLAFLAASLACASAAGAELGPNHVTSVKLSSIPGAEGGAEIEVVGTATPTYNVRAADGGTRLFVEIANADVLGAKAAITDPAGVVGGVLTQGYRTATGSVTRLVVNLSKKATYRVRVDGTTLRLTLTPDGAPAGTVTGPTAKPAAEPAAPPSPAAKAASSAEKSASPAEKASAPAVRDAKSIAGEIRLEDVGFDRKSAAGRGERCAGGCDRVVIKASVATPYTVSVTPKGALRLALRGAHVPESLARTLDVSEFKGSLRTITTFYDQAQDAAIVEVERDGDAQGHLVAEGGKLVWTFENGTVDGRAAREKSGPVRHTVSLAKDASPGDSVPKVTRGVHEGEEVQVETTGGAEAGFASSASNATSGQMIGTGNRYSGRRIDLDLKDADIHNILRLLADVGKVNIITADDVVGSITIRMRNVPWDQALDVVLQAKSLGMVRSGNLVRVAPAATLNKERELLVAKVKSDYELTPLETRLIPVSYAEAAEIQLRAKEMLSPRGSLSVDDRTNVIIARDIGPNLNHIEELIRSLDTQTPQVLIEARIVEAASRYLRDVGIQWGGDATFSDATGNPTGLAFPSRMSLAGGATDGQTPTAGLSPFSRTVSNPNFAVNLPAPVGTGQGGAIGMSFGSVDGNYNLSVRLTAAEGSGMVRIVSSPRILTLDNKTARINTGTLIPFSQVSAQGVQTTFQEAKLQLLVKPHVTADGAVSMHVKVNRDEPDFNQTSARGDPTILKREAETDLLVMDGHTAVIGGIFTRNTGRNVDQVPFFGDIPILGVLFQRRRATDQRNELVIFLTPRIVNRAEALGR